MLSIALGLLSGAFLRLEGSSDSRMCCHLPRSDRPVNGTVVTLVTCVSLGLLE